MHFFSSQQAKLLSACYPPHSALPTAGPEYLPNSHELSRLTYYASNNPGKLTKLGIEVEKHLKNDCRRAQTGNVRSRASLLISLAILRALATECRRDIALLSPYLLTSVESTLASISSDLEVVARVASVFTAWTTYTNGQLIGADSALTSDYLSILRRFATLSCCTLPDQETQNRTRLVGLAALTSAVNSDALHNDSSQFRAQVSVILKPIISILFSTKLAILSEQCATVKDTPASPYLVDFRARPTLERRAASIHIHVDGDKGPTTEDVSDAALRALYCLLSHANGSQLGLAIQSCFDCMNELNAWSQDQQCRWFAQTATEWAQYQYRYVVPTYLVERLMVNQDAPSTLPIHAALVSMITHVLNLPSSIINLSSSDMLSNLTNFLLRRVSISQEDPILPSLVGCIASLACHVYYSDQIQDLSSEIIGKLVMIEVQEVLSRDNQGSPRSRSFALRYLLSGLLGLIRVANTTQNKEALEIESKDASITPRLDISVDDRGARRTRVPPDIWQDTLSLLCHPDPAVRAQAASVLSYYLGHELPQHGETTDTEESKQFRGLSSHSYRHAIQTSCSQSNDNTSNFINAAHAFLFILATSPNLEQQQPLGPSRSKRSSSDKSGGETGSTRRSSIGGALGRRPRKDSLVLRILAQTPTSLSDAPRASEEDYSHLLQILLAIHRHFPIRGLLAGVPMILALDRDVNECLAQSQGDEPQLKQRMIALQILLANVWQTIGQVWRIPSLVTLAQEALSRLSAVASSTDVSELRAAGIYVEEALKCVAGTKTVQDIVGLDYDQLIRRLSMKWTPDQAFRTVQSTPTFNASVRGDGVSPLLKISPALMHIENMSLQSLSRTARGLGVTDLREALEGRGGMSNPALASARAPSFSTLEHASSVWDPSLRLTPSTSRPKAKKRHPATGGEVRDMLTKLGISKQNSELPKVSVVAPSS